MASADAPIQTYSYTFKWQLMHIYDLKGKALNANIRIYMVYERERCVYELHMHAARVRIIFRS